MSNDNGLLITRSDVCILIVVIKQLVDSSSNTN